MNEEDEFISVRRLRSTRTSLETSVKHSMNDEASPPRCPPRTGLAKNSGEASFGRSPTAHRPHLKG